MGRILGKTPIPDEKVEEFRASLCMDEGFDPVRANRDLWSFLNLNVTGTKAESKLRAVKRLRGLEAWRSIVVPIEPKTMTKRRELHHKVHHPNQCKKLSEVESAIAAWEKNRDEYYECGGQAIEESEQCTIILDLLPEDTPSTLMMALEDYEGDFEELKRKIDKQITFLTDHAKSHNGKIHLTEDRPPSKAPSTSGEDSEAEESQDGHASSVDLTSFAEPMQSEIFSMMRAKGDKRPVKMSNRGRFQSRNGGGAGSDRATNDRRTKTPPQGSGVRKTKCGNCGSESHQTRECPKPQVARESVSVSTVMKRVMRQRIVLIQRRMREVARKLVLAKALTLLSVGTARTGRWWSGQKMKKVSKEWDNDR